jgi:hypothetical protein
VTLMPCRLQTVIDRKFEPFVHRLLVKYLGELEDDDVVLFVLEHLKDHKSPQKLVDGLEPVRTHLTFDFLASRLLCTTCYVMIRRAKLIIYQVLMLLSCGC